MSYACRRCGECHRGLPMSYGTDAPAYWDPSLAGDKSSTLEQEQCIIKDEHFFVRGRLVIPVTDAARTEFDWGVWVVGQRPLIELEPTDHPLAVEQRTGITLVRVHEIAETLLHALPAALHAHDRYQARLSSVHADSGALRPGSWGGPHAWSYPISRYDAPIHADMDGQVVLSCGAQDGIVLGRQTYGQ